MTDTKDMLRALAKLRRLANENLDQDAADDEEPWNHDESSMDSIDRGERIGKHNLALEILEILGEDDD